MSSKGASVEIGSAQQDPPIEELPTEWHNDLEGKPATQAMLVLSLGVLAGSNSQVSSLCRILAI